jgi:hypothetical protein
MIELVKHKELFGTHIRVSGYKTDLGNNIFLEDFSTQWVNVNGMAEIHLRMNRHFLSQPNTENYKNINDMTIIRLNKLIHPSHEATRLLRAPMTGSKR